VAVLGSDVTKIIIKCMYALLFIVYTAILDVVGVGNVRELIYIFAHLVPVEDCNALVAA